MAKQTARDRAERKRVEAKRELVDGALEVFAERGYHATRVADITTYLGVGQSTFYKHFNNKRDVVQHVLDQQLANALDAVAEENSAAAAKSLDEYVAQARRIAVGLFSALIDDPRALKVLIFEAASVDPELTHRWNGILDSARAVIAEYYRHGAAKGYFREDIDVAAHSDAVVGLLLGGLLRALRDPADHAAHHRYTDAVLAMIIGGAAPTNPLAPGSGTHEYDTT